MNNNRVSFGYWDLPSSYDKAAKAMTPEICQKLIDEFILFTAKGVEQNQFTPAFTKIV